MSDAPPQVADPAEIDWKAAQVFIRGRITRELYRADSMEIDDLVQEASVGLLRTLRREAAINLEALMTTVAHRVVVDWVRRRGRQPAPVDIEGIDVPSSGSPGAFADPRDRVEFMMLEYFRVNRSAACLELARYYFSRLDWGHAAERLNRSHAAVRKQWSRCAERFVEFARHSDHELLAWTRTE